MEKENIAKELWLEVNCLLHMYLHKKISSMVLEVQQNQ